MKRWILQAVGAGGTPWDRPPWACPFCNVDGPATRAFLAVVFGAFFLSALSLLLWALVRAGGEEVEAPATRMLENEEAYTVRLQGGQDHDR